jgi:MtN3 and saliva related transmembrane protein
MNEIIGFVAGSVVSLAFIPQIVQMLRSKNTKAVSFSTYLMYGLGSGIWVFYGIRIKSLSLIVFNCMTFIISILVLYFKRKYD